MELYQDKFIVMECLSSSIEMYQVKTFYYQNIPGIRKFRFSMSQNKSFLYYENRSVVSLIDFLQQNKTVSYLYRILHQIQLILLDSSNYLLYPSNFCMHPNWIKIIKENEELKIELMYIPFKEGYNVKSKEYSESFVRIISKAFNELNDMEGFYYFIRLLEEFNNEEFSFDLSEHLEYFLNSNTSRIKGKNRMI